MALPADHLDAAMRQLLGFFDRALFAGMDIAYADDAQYCLQMAHEGAWYKLAGPGGSPARSACV